MRELRTDDLSVLCIPAWALGAPLAEEEAWNT